HDALLTARILDLAKFYNNAATTTPESSKLLCRHVPINALLQQQQQRKMLTVDDFSVFASLNRSEYVLAATAANTLSLNSFKLLLGYILAGIDQAMLGLTTDITWLQRIYFSSSSVGGNNNKSTPSSAANLERNSNQLWFWALWECAQFCTQCKMKT